MLATNYSSNSDDVYFLTIRAQSAHECSEITIIKYQTRFLDQRVHATQGLKIGFNES